MDAKRKFKVKTELSAAPDRTQILILFSVLRGIKANTEESFICLGDDVRRRGGIDYYQSEEAHSHVHSRNLFTHFRLYFTITRNAQMHEGSLPLERFFLNDIYS